MIYKYKIYNLKKSKMVSEHCFRNFYFWLGVHCLFQMSSKIVATFPPEGMSCPVLGCNGYTFLRHKQLVFHWKKYHEPVVTLYRCECCQKFFGRKGDAQQHLKRQHRPFITPMTKLNSLYIPPGNASLPKANRQPETPTTSGHLPDTTAVTPEQITRRAARDAAAEERRLQAAAARSTPLYRMSTREIDNILLPDSEPEQDYEGV